MANRNFRNVPLSESRVLSPRHRALLLACVLSCLAWAFGRGPTFCGPLGPWPPAGTGQHPMPAAHRVSQPSFEGLRCLRLNQLSRRAADPKGFSELKKQLQIQAVGRGRGSFIFQMGGVKILVNPNLQGSNLKPETVHEDFDYVFLTSEEPEFFHRDTVAKMKLTKVKFVASAKAGQELAKMMVRNLAVLQNGPGGQCFLQSRDKSGAAVGILSAPGAGGLPWERQEQAFVFVNLENGEAVAYEAFGQFLGRGAGSNKPGIPEEAYQVDYLITPDLREAAGVASGLAEKGAKLKAVLRLPGEGNPLDDDVNPLSSIDRAFGIEDTAEDFQSFLEDQGSKKAELSETKLIMLTSDERVDLTPSA